MAMPYGHDRDSILIARMEKKETIKLVLAITFSLCT